MQLVRYNVWSNRRVFDLTQKVDPARLRETDEGSVGSVEDTLKHLVSVEDSYLAMLRGQDLEQVFGLREAYEAHDLTWFSARAGAAGEGYAALIAERDEAWLASPMQVP